MDIAQFAAAFIPGKRRRTILREKLRLRIKLRRFFAQKRLYSVLLVIHDLCVSGAPLAALQLAKVVQRDGGSVFVIGLKPGPLAAEFTALGIPVAQAEVFLDSTVAIHCASDAGFDHIVLNTIVCWEWSRHLDERDNVIWWLHEAGLVDAFLEKHPRRAECEAALCRARHLYVVSEYALEVVAKYAKNIRLLRLGLDDHHVLAPGQRSDGQIRFTLIGAFCANKGQRVLLDAVALLEPGVARRAEFRLVGKKSGSFYQEILEQASHLDNIHLLEEVPDQQEKWRLYAETDVVCVVSLDESCSLVALEACMMGKPLIVSRHVGARYMVEEGLNGFVVETGDAHSLSSALRRCILLKDTLSDMGNHSRKQYFCLAHSGIFHHNALAMLGREQQFDGVTPLP